jgi:predicted transcriptional regulator
VIPQRSAEQAIILAEQGWTVSAIARHLGHDRKTIRIYLSDRRTFKPHLGGGRQRVWGEPLPEVANADFRTTGSPQGRCELGPVSAERACAGSL